MSPRNDGSKTGLEPIARRIPIRSKIDLNFHNFEGLVTGVSANLSTTGMFIQTDNPEAVGSECSFEIRIEDWSPIQGTAQVIWNRTRTEGPERPAGMGVRFLELDPQSRRMIRWLVDKHLEDGGRPFDPNLVPPGASSVSRRKPAITPEGAGREEGTFPRRARGGKRQLWLLLAVVAIAGLASAAYYLWLERQPGRGRLPAPGSGQPEIELPEEAVPTEQEAPDAATTTADTAVRVSAEGVMSFIESWETAWESRQPETLLALYSEDFQAGAYGGKEAWRAEVTRQMEQAAYIRVAVSALEIEFPHADLARASFFRSFRSNLKDETRRMVLELEPAADSWKIQVERYAD